MILLDKILFAPLYGVMWLAEKINENVAESQLSEKDEITQTLTELYLQLEAGAITEDYFSEQESSLLDRLDALEEENKNE